MASDEFFCSKNVRESEEGSVGVLLLVVDEPVRMSVLKRGLMRDSNFFLDAADEAA